MIGWIVGFHTYFAIYQSIQYIKEFDLNSVSDFINPACAPEKMSRMTPNTNFINTNSLQ